MLLPPRPDRPVLLLAPLLAPLLALLLVGATPAAQLPGSVDYTPELPPTALVPRFEDRSADVSAPGTVFADVGVGRGQAWVDVVGPDPSDPGNPDAVGPPDGRLDLVQANSDSPALPLGSPSPVLPAVGNVVNPCVVFRAEPDGTFRDVTAAMTLGPGVGFDLTFPGGSPWGVLAADHDGDGDVDLYFPCGGFNLASRNALLENQGDGTFAYVSAAAGVQEVQATFCATWFDYDLDGDLDLFEANSTEITPVTFQGPTPDAVDRLLQNDGSGSFVDVAPQAGVDLRSAAFSSVAADLDLDGAPDLVEACFRQLNKVFYNNGDGTFSFMAPQSNGAVNLTLASLVPDPGLPGTVDFGFLPPALADSLPIESFSTIPTDVVDFNGDGWLDIFYVSWSIQIYDQMNTTGAEGSFFGPAEPHRLYLNLGDQDGDGVGDGFFREVAEEVGLGVISGQMGLIVADYNNDGAIDIYGGNGGPFVNYQLEEDFLFVNEGSLWPDDFQEDPHQPLPKTLYEVGAVAGVYGNTFMGHGLTQRPNLETGRVDVIVGNGGPAVFGAGQSNVYYRNLGTSPREGRALFVDLESDAATTGVYGARVEVLRVSAEGDPGLGVQERRASVGFASSNLGPLAFGLGDDAALYARVAWPGGPAEDGSCSARAGASRSRSPSSRSTSGAPARRSSPSRSRTAEPARSTWTCVCRASGSCRPSPARCCRFPGARPRPNRRTRRPS